MKAKDLTDKEFGNLVALYIGKRDKHGHIMWLCRCDCGETKLVRIGDLIGGGVKSCGCLNSELKKGKLNINWDGGKKTFTCDECGEVFKKYRSMAKDYDYHFCGNECRHKWRAKFIMGENNPHYKPKVKRSCGFCGKELEVWPSKAKSYENSFCKNGKCYPAWMMDKNRGENNPNWRNGSKQNPYCEIWLDNEYKSSIINRDGGKCLNPKCKHISDLLHIHHIDYDKLNCHPWNLITLCNSCHSLSNFSRENHTLYYQDLMTEFYNYEYEQQLSLLEAVNQ